MCSVHISVLGAAALGAPGAVAVSHSELFLLARPRQSLSSLAVAVKEIEEIPAYLPSGAALKDAVQKAQDWLQEVEALQVCQRSSELLHGQKEVLSGRCCVRGAVSSACLQHGALCSDGTAVGKRGLSPCPGLAVSPDWAC